MRRLACELRLVRGQSAAIGMDDALSIDGRQMFVRCTHRLQQAQGRGPGCAAAETHDSNVRQFFPLNVEGIQQAGDDADRRTVLIVVEYGHFAALAQCRFDFETLGCGDVFDVDAAETVRDTRHRVDELGRVCAVDFDVHAIEVGETLE